MSGLLTFGEAMLRLSPPDAERLERTDRLDVNVAGAESNLAVAATRAGCEATWMSKLPDSPLGRRVRNGLREIGLETAVVWSDGGRQPIYYVESGPSPRGTDVIYDRQRSPMRSASVDELPVERVTDAAVFATSGITPALSETLADTVGELLDRAGRSDVTTAFDINYRAKLWSPAAARDTLESYLDAVDILFIGEDDAATLFGMTGSPTEVVRAVSERWSVETAVLTRGSWGAMARTNDTTVTQRAFETETVDPIGTGDAFAGGFIARWLEGGSTADALAFAAATAALKRTVPGDMAVITRDEIERVLAADDRDIHR